MVVQVAIWHDYYAAHPWYLAGPLAAVAWGGAAAAYLRRRRPAWPLIVLDSSFYAALAIRSGMCVPPDMRGVAGNWLYIAMASQVVVTVWFAPRVLAVLLGLVPEAAYWASAAVTPPGRVQGNTPVVSGALLLVVLVIHWTAAACSTAGPPRPTAGSPPPTRKHTTSTSSCPGTSSGANTSACCTTPC